MSVKNCRVCGCEFEAVGNNRTCYQCRAKIDYDRREREDCEVCGKPLEWTQKRYCSYECQHSTAKWRNDPQTCSHCGKQFFKKTKSKYCSKECRSADSFCHSMRVCEQCGKDYTPFHDTSRFCSLDCMQAARTKRIAGDLSRNVVVQSCKECGKSFTPVFEHIKYCSLQCQRSWNNRISSGTRRARKRKNGHQCFDPLDVLRRDKWTCQLCGIKTPRRLRGTTDDRAPELDHIVPLALGGAHTIENTQCLCRKCNIEKGATAAGQLALDLVLAA